jgi:hypothetical protein
MAHNDENSPPERGTKSDKVPQSGLCCRVSDADDPQSGPNWAAGGGTRAYQDGKGAGVRGTVMEKRAPADRIVLVTAME